jgi:crotonobetainyl-CoA:carnitine CoA-transferase CaiB-like acyl-CoA transferase
VKRSPLLGEHTGDILRTLLGLDDDEIEDAQKEGAI